LTAEEVLSDLEEFLQPILDFLKGAPDEKMEQQFKVPFGSGGPPEYYFRLCKIVKIQYPDFEPEGMEEWEAEQSEQRIGTADRKIKELVASMQEYIFKTLREMYGDAKDAYWHKGLTDKEMKAKAYSRSLDASDEDDRLPLENYLDVI